MRRLLAVLLFLAGAGGCATAPPAPVAPATLRQQIVDPTPWALDTSASDVSVWVRATTPNVWDDPDLARLGVQCDTVERRLAVVLVVNASPWLVNDADDESDDVTDDDEDEGFFEGLIIAIIEGFIHHDYVPSRAYWDEGHQQSMEWAAPAPRGGLLVMEAQDDADELLPTLRAHDLLLLVVDFLGYGERTLVFDLREHRTMDDAIGAVLHACRRQRGLE